MQTYHDCAHPCVALIGLGVAGDANKGDCDKGSVSVLVGASGVRTGLRVGQLSFCSQVLLLPLGVPPMPEPPCFTQSIPKTVTLVMFHA